MIQTIRLHFVTSDVPWTTANNGTVNADFRGPRFIGKAQGDHHATGGRELDVDDATEAGGLEIAAALLIAPAVNRWLQGETATLEADVSQMEAHVLAFLSKTFAELVPVATQIIEVVAGVHPRMGVWSKKAEDGS